MNISSVSLGAVLLLLGNVRAQDSTCDFDRTVVPGNVYTASGPLSGGSYRGGTRCRWVFTCPTNYKCRVDCPDIAIPKVDNVCSVDRLLISLTGDRSLASALYYCGSGSLSNQVSTNTQVAIGLTSTASSPGGRFYCEVRAVYDTTSPNCACGYKKVNRIVGGVNTQPNEYPMMAGILYQERGDTIMCGATIISDQWVVTAGHCVAQRNPAETGVVVGEHDIKSGTDTSDLQLFRADLITVHPQFTATNYNNDIACMKVLGTIKFSDSVGPVCLPFKYSTNNFAGSQVEMLGWGTTYSGGPTSNVLQKVTVNVISQAACSSVAAGITSSKICTYTPGKDACQNDSGGPVLYTDPTTRRLILLGIISYGRFCAGLNDPAINTYVPAYTQWIVSVTSASFCRV